MAENGANGNGFDLRKLSFQALWAIVIAVASSAASLIIWQGSVNSRLAALEARNKQIDTGHYAWRFPDMWAWCIATENLNENWRCSDPYAIPSSSGDPPLFPQTVNRALKGPAR